MTTKSPEILLWVKYQGIVMRIPATPREAGTGLTSATS